MTDHERLKNHVRDLETRIALLEVKAEAIQREIDGLQKVLVIDTETAPQFDLTDVKETPNG